MTTETTRVEAFSDGVFAIAITLLILEIKVPSVGGGDLGDQLLRQWPSYLSFFISFAFIGDHVDQPPSPVHPHQEER